MYSIALLMALTGGSEVSDGHRHGGCGGCGGYTASCGCGGGGHRHHGRRHHGGGGCCGETSCCAPVVSSGCCGCYGGAGYGGAGYGAPGYYGAPGMQGPAGEPLKAMPKPKATSANASATIIVELPADATLRVDGQATASTSGVRVLVSPELPAGKEFHYTLSAKVVRDGKPVEVEQTVAVRAGEESRVSLSLPVAVAQR